MLDFSQYSRTDALLQATETAQALVEGAARLGRCRFDQAPLLALVPFLTALGNGQGSDIQTCSPAIREVLLFGSIANDEDVVGDIDLMVLDNGFYSMLVNPEDDDDNAGILPDSKGQCLQDNLTLLLSDFFQYDDDLISRLLFIPTDLHVIRYTVVTDEAFRAELSSQHRDPDFFENAFSCMMRYDIDMRTFVPTTLNEIRERLQTESD